MMSYCPDPTPGGQDPLRYFCGKCALKNRGWAVTGIAPPAGGLARPMTRGGWRFRLVAAAIVTIAAAVQLESQGGLQRVSDISIELSCCSPACWCRKACGYHNSL